jgi:multiple sugar transport system permease protein
MMREPGALGNRSRKLFVYALLILATIIALFPIYWIFLTSIKTPMEVTSGVPKFFNFQPTLENYAIVLGLSTGGGRVSGAGSGHVAFLTYFKNTLIIVPSAVLLSLLLGLPVAYAMARYRFKLRENLYFFFLSLYFMPAALILIPLYLVYQRLGLYNTRLGLVLILQLINLPLVVLIMRSFFEDISAEIEQSAMVDGSSRLRAFVKITFPLALPGLMSTLFLSTIFSWNNFMFGVILATTKTQPVTVGILAYKSYEAILWGQMAAASLITAVPVLILAILIQRYIVQGLSLGAVKG